MVRTGSLQESAIATEDLVQGITREVEEALRDVYDGVVGEGRVGNGEILLTSGQCAHEAEIGFHQRLDGTEAAGHGEGREFSLGA